MSAAKSEAAKYEVPTGILGLAGPIAKPAPGTLPLRGDLAHIALAGSHLAAHYAIPQIRHIGPAGSRLQLEADDEAQTTADLAPGAKLEVLDHEGEWVWGCLGPQGPSGYCPAKDLAAPTPSDI